MNHNIIEYIIPHEGALSKEEFGKKFYNIPELKEYIIKVLEEENFIVDDVLEAFDVNNVEELIEGIIDIDYVEIYLRYFGRITDDEMIKLLF